MLPKFDFSQITGALDPRNICIKIDSSDAGQRLTELREKLCEFMGINISSTADSFNNWERKRDNFLKRITALSEKDSYEINS